MSRMEHRVTAEAAARTDHKVAKLVREACLKLPSTCVEGIVCLKNRRLSRDRLARLAACSWVEARKIVAIISKTGFGKSFTGQAFDNVACRRLLAVRYARLADILDDLNRCRAAADDNYCEHMDLYKTVQPIIVNTFMTMPATAQNSIDPFEIMEAREGSTAILIASQIEANE